MTKGHNTNRMFFWKALSPIQIFFKSGALYVKEKNIILTVKKIQSYSRIVKCANRDRCSIYQRERVVNNHLRIAPEKGFAETNSSKIDEARDVFVFLVVVTVSPGLPPYKKQGNHRKSYVIYENI